MVSRKQLGTAFGELFIVILGVMIALAADSWREDLKEAQIASEYLDRLNRDVSAGLKVLANERARYVEVRRAAKMVFSTLDGELEAANDQSLAANFIVAAQTGFDREEMASDVTYNELVVSGRLNLIEDHSIRESVVAYYRGAQRLAFGLQSLPRVNYVVGALTGYLPVEYSSFGEELTAGDRARIMEALKNDPQLVRNIRQLHSELTFHDRLFESLIAQGQHLLTLME